ncbi:MAG: alpha/beta hydrolase [Bryobacterales bacterium]|nr:alpha/beta hydrolase [Bryobacterales bacterium]
MMLPLALLLLAAPPATEHLAVADGHVLVWRSHSLTEGAHPTVERAVIMVHGTGRNAEEYYRWTLAATLVADQLDQTAVVAPHFKARTRDNRGDDVTPGEWYWTNEAWKSGDAATNGKVFSYDVADRILELFNDVARFPNLKEIVVAGHSAGGQYVQRYAAFNRAEPRLHIPVRYVVANPSSYVYLNEQRPRGEGFGRYSDAENCTTYNQYRYGLEKLTGYAAQTPIDVIRAQFPRRTVAYLVSELDTRTDDPNLDKSCPAIAQGPNRRERGTNFANYMKAQYGAQHTFAIAPACGHSAVCVFAGPAGVKAVFGR